MKDLGNRIRLLAITPLVMACMPGTAFANTMDDFWDSPQFTATWQMSHRDQNNILSDRYNDRNDKQKTNNRVQRSELGKVLLNAIFPEKVIRLKKLQGNNLADGLTAHRHPRMQYQFGMSYLGAQLKVRTFDDALGMSLDSDRSETQQRLMKIGVKVRW